MIPTPASIATSTGASCLGCAGGTMAAGEASRSTARGTGTAGIVGGWTVGVGAGKGTGTGTGAGAGAGAGTGAGAGRGGNAGRSVVSAWMDPTTKLAHARPPLLPR